MVVGAHSFLNKDFVEKSVDTFLETIKREPKLIGVGGVCVTEYENRLGELVGLVYSSFFSGARSCRYRKDGHFSDSVIFGLFNRNEVIKNGCFDEDFLAAGDDDELTIRLHNRGYKFFTNPDILSHYYVRNSLGKFITQTYNYGVAKGFMVRKGLNKIEPFNSASLWFVPAGFLVYEILLLLALGVFGISWSLALALIPFISYWLAVIGISLLLYKRTKSRLCFLLPFTYFLFHNILGLSSILGLLLKGKAFR
jgi:GT2 family glycosyltransferase